jgi:hypothetical protein
MKMINKLDKPFGPAGTSAGLVLLFAGVLTVSRSLFSLILIFIGAFMGFTSTSSIIDTKSKKVKFSNNLFGIFRIGKWVPIESGMKIGIRKSDQIWRTSSWSNRVLDIRQQDYRIVLFDFDEKEVITLKKEISQKAARTQLSKLSQQLGLKAQ